jgi:hypothetical protein
MTPVPSEITSQLVDWSNGDGDALESYYRSWNTNSPNQRHQSTVSVYSFADFSMKIEKGSG